MQHKVLGPCCEAIADARAQAADARDLEKDQKTIAHQAMKKEDRTSFRSHGIELARVPGEEKLRVRATKKQESTTSVQTEETQPQGGELGDGQGVEGLQTDTGDE